MDRKRIIAAATVIITLIGSPTLAGSTPQWVPEKHAVTSTAGYDCGDINDDGTLLDISDLVYLIDYMFQSGPPPPLTCQADLDGDGQIDISDLVVLVDYMFVSGPLPTGCCLNVDQGGFTIEAPYTYVRSYPGGGGLFLVHMTPGDGFAGNVFLTITADDYLNVQLDRDVLSDTAQVSELTIIPDDDAPIEWRQIVLTASHAGVSQDITLDVEMFPWGSDGIENAETKRAPLVEWAEANYPELGSLSDQDWYGYVTYPQIWVVEHWTFLSDDWELRICFQVMIPPYDWSMLRLRRRGEIDPILAAKRESDGTTYEIPLSEYPTFDGY